MTIPPGDKIHPSQVDDESSSESASKFGRFKEEIGAAIQRSVGVRADVTGTSRFESILLHAIRDPDVNRNQHVWLRVVLR
jgi:hypothetical protein